MRGIIALALIATLSAAAASADGPADNVAANVRPIPPNGIAVPEATEKELRDKLALLERLLAEWNQPGVERHLPSVQVFHRAVKDALTYHEFFSPRDVEHAQALLREGINRARLWSAWHNANWDHQIGPVVRGYVSRIDGSVQPYGLYVPASYSATGKDKHRLDIWFHGRGETQSEVNFIYERMTQSGLFTPPNTIVLHPYGRYCNAFKFAGEVDVYEALADVMRYYRIDPDRISVRGFSMGGAAAWHFAVHNPGRWFAANPGAGFSETPRFLDVFQKEKLDPPWYEKKLWNLYDCDKWAINILHCPTVAYSGELDSQKQAADVMAEALRHEGLELTHVIGPETKHSYHPSAKLEVEDRLESLARLGRNRTPESIVFDTFTLKYNNVAWLTVDALEEHWKHARVRVQRGEENALGVVVENVTALTIDMKPGTAAFPNTGPVLLSVNGQSVKGPLVQTDGSWRCQLHRAGSTWTLGPVPNDGLRKRHNLQGPIDDAFMDAFVFVRPTGKSERDRVAAWVKSEQDRAIREWRRHFRGEPRVKDDASITDADIAAMNLVLWGDPESNSVLKRIVDKLPIEWKSDAINAGEQSFGADDHALIAIYPNPLNPARYVVLNSGFTFREYDYLNNARQTPKLPDWAIVDTRTLPDARHPGKIAAADFFGERWELKRQRDSVK